MAYTPVGWQTGDTITAERLNRMDRGWDVSTTELFSETVTTADNGDGEYVANLSYTQRITADSLAVTFDGTEYTCPRIDFNGTCFYGGFDPDNGPDFSKYPFTLASMVNVFTGEVTNTLGTQTAGEHTVSVSVTALQTSADFDIARGYGYSRTVLFTETVMAASADTPVQLSYSGNIDAAIITVNLDGTEYECANRVQAPYGDYGAMPRFPSGYDFSTFPFFIGSNSGVNRIAVETAGEHTVSVTVASMQVSPDFSSAVDAASTIDATMVPLRCVSGETTYDEMGAALIASRLMYFRYSDTGAYYMVTNAYGDSSGKHVFFIPDDSSFTAGFDENDVFTLTPAS